MFDFSEGDIIKYKYKINKIDERYLECIYNKIEYHIIPIQKNEKSDIISFTIKDLSSIKHKNILNIEIEEDDKYFYMIYEYDNMYLKEIYNTLKKDRRILVECYIQISEAIIFLHGKNVIHGNITPYNIVVDKENIVYLLDFGKNYLYCENLYKISREKDILYHSPEQLKMIEEPINSETDIFSFGLSMLQLLTDSIDENIFKSYKSPEDLDNIFQMIYNKNGEYINNLKNEDKQLFPLIKKTLEINPNDRIKPNELKEELIRIHKEISSQNQQKYLISIFNTYANKYKMANRINSDLELIANLASKNKKHYPYLLYCERENDDEIHILIDDLILFCSADYNKNPHYFFCFSIREDTRKSEDIKKNGIMYYDISFEFKIGNPDNIYNFNDIKSLVDELYNKYQENKKEYNNYKIDIKSIENEEDLLKKEEEVLNDKKMAKICSFDKLTKSSNTITFLAYNDSDKKEFKTGNKVIISKVPHNQKNKIDDIANLEEDNIICSGVVERDIIINGKENIIIEIDEKQKIELNKNNTFKKDEKQKYNIAYDYTVEEILLNKRKSALNQLKSGNAQIPYLLRKINEPSVLKDFTLKDIDNIDNKDLDNNQKEAVQKAISLTSDSEFMLIQGPPGTGKTTTIVEIIKNILKDKKRNKILISSQSNQALDNVLEKICDDNENIKVLRIGRDKNKISEKAQLYTEEKVLDKIINDTIKRIKSSNIEDRFKHLQKDFLEKIQTVSSKVHLSDKNGIDYEIGNIFLKHINVFFGTLLGISSIKDWRSTIFNMAIVDESGRATLSELLVPIIKSDKFALVGDHKQLAPVIDDDVCSKLKNDNSDIENIKTSFFERLFYRMEKENKELFKHILTTNYRSEDKICQLYNNAFYDGILKTSDNIIRNHNLSKYTSSVVVVSTSGIEKREEEQKGTGKINRLNAEIIKNILLEIFEGINNNNLNKTIGIITPYKAQAVFLKEYLFNNISDFKDRNIDIGTVDSFQGSDRAYIIYDSVRSQKNPKGNKIDFIADEKRLNVSLSRAKELLVIVGDIDFLYKSTTSDNNNPFKSIIGYIYNNENKYNLYDAKNYTDVENEK